MSSINRRSYFILPIAVAGLLVSVAAQALTQTARVNVDRISSRVSNDRICITTATTLEPIPGTTVKFNQGTNDQVVVTFVASWPKPREDEIPAGSQAAGAFIFLFIDGNRVDINSINGGVLVHDGSTNSISNGTHGFTFVTDPIPPGEHEAKIYFLDNVLGPPNVLNGTLCVSDRSVIVQHKK